MLNSLTVQFSAFMFSDDKLIGNFPSTGKVNWNFRITFRVIHMKF